MEVVVKAYLQETGAPVEVRRIAISTSGQDTNGVFKETYAKVGKAFPGLANKVFSLKWQDSDGDLVMMSTDEEMNEALSQAQSNVLKLFITVDGAKETCAENKESSQANGTQEPSATHEPSSGDKKESDDDQKQDPFWGPFESAGFCDPMSFFMSRKRGHPDSRNPRGGHFAFQFGNMGPRGHPFGNMGPRGHPFGHMGPRGHHFDNFNPRDHPFGNMGPRGHPSGHMGPRGHHFDFSNPRGHHFGHMGSRGHPFGHMGSRGHHFDHSGTHRGSHHFGFQMGMQGPFEGQVPFEGQGCCEGEQTCQGPHVHFEHHYKHHDKHNHEEGGWKARLRDAVPVAHRRWAKTYIRDWRVQNLKNATSTSSDNDQEIFTMETASVPESYAIWLDTFLPKWHKRQGQEDASTNTEKEKNKEEKNKLKASVPLEFRKWVKWYLARHFGKKESPKFRKEKFEEKMDKRNKKEWKKSFKMDTLSPTIPSEHRLWAKKFIQDWRQEHKIEDPKAGEAATAESETTEKAPAAAVPAEYVKWMNKFLGKWHLEKGEISGQTKDFEKKQKGEFKDTVPKNFRKWVKCYMWTRYGKTAENEEAASNLKQYKKLMKAFQKKWVHEQSKGNLDEFVLTSSDDDDEQTMEGCLKKLRLDQEKAKTSDSDSGEYEAAFEWFRQAPWQQWDGTTQDGTADAEQMSPQMYKWMAKKMMKKQKKAMKKDLKHAMKAHKYC